MSRQTVSKVIWWKGWSIRRSRDGTWRCDKPGKACCFTASTAVGSAISAVLLHEGIYRGAGFLDRGSPEYYAKLEDRLWRN